MSEPRVTLNKATFRRMARRCTSRNEGAAAVEEATYSARATAVEKLIYSSDRMASLDTDYVPRDRIIDRLILHVGEESVTHIHAATDYQTKTGRITAFTPTRLITVTYSAAQPVQESVASAAVPLSSVREIEITSVSKAPVRYSQRATWPSSVGLRLTLEHPVLGSDVIELVPAGTDAEFHERTEALIGSLPVA